MKLKYLQKDILAHQGVETVQFTFGFNGNTWKCYILSRKEGIKSRNLKNICR